MAVNLSSFIPGAGNYSGGLEADGAPYDPVGAVRMFAKGGPSTLFNGKYILLSESENVPLLKSAYPELFAFLGYRGIYYYPQNSGGTSYSVKASDIMRYATLTFGTPEYYHIANRQAYANETRTGICYQNGSNVVFTIKRPADSSFTTFSVTPASLSIPSSSYFVFGTINKDCTKVAIYCYASNAYRVKIYNIEANNTLTFVRETASYPCTPARMCWSDDNNTIVVRASNYTGASLYRIHSIDVATGNVVQSSGAQPDASGSSEWYSETSGRRTLAKVPGKNIYLASDGSNIRSYKIVGGVVTYMNTASGLTAGHFSSITAEGSFYAGTYLAPNAVTNINSSYVYAFKVNDDGSFVRLDTSFANFYTRPMYYSVLGYVDYAGSMAVYDLELDIENGLLFMFGGNFILVFKTSLHLGVDSTDSVKNTPVYVHLQGGFTSSASYDYIRLTSTVRNASGGFLYLYSVNDASGGTIYGGLMFNGGYIENVFYLPTVKQTVTYNRYNNASPYFSSETLKLRDTLAGSFYIRAKP